MKNWRSGIKILGVSLLLIVIPGSTFMLPILFSQKKFRKLVKMDNDDSDEDLRMIGI
jgi:hypothetical protein